MTNNKPPCHDLTAVGLRKSATIIEADFIELSFLKQVFPHWRYFFGLKLSTIVHVLVLEMK